MTNNSISNEILLENLKWRSAIKKFDPNKKISDSDWNTIEDSLVLSPSSYGLQPWKFYVITDEAVRKELTPHSWNQPQISACSHLVVFAAKKDLSSNDVEKYVNRITEVRGTPAADLEALKNSFLMAHKSLVETKTINEWAVKQCYLALGFGLSAAAMIGIDACPMEGFSPKDYDTVLNIEQDGYFSVVISTFGYRSKEDRISKLSKVRYDKTDLIKRI